MCGEQARGNFAMSGLAREPVNTRITESAGGRGIEQDKEQEKLCAMPGELDEKEGLRPGGPLQMLDTGSDSVDGPTQ